MAHHQFSPTGFLVANPVAAQTKNWTGRATTRLWRTPSPSTELQGVSGKEVTPALLAEFARHTDGVSVQVNRDLVVNERRFGGRDLHLTRLVVTSRVVVFGDVMLDVIVRRLAPLAPTSDTPSTFA